MQKGMKRDSMGKVGTSRKGMRGFSGKGAIHQCGRMGH
jgi:hypothetical protein